MSLGPSERQAPVASQPLAPLILVEGFLSTTSSLFWGTFETYLNGQRDRLGIEGRRRVIFTSVGPVSSFHDRACELFYAIVGGTVDYGEEHTQLYGHARYGRHHETGLYPSWSRTDPIHVLGHSIGGPTALTLIALLRKGFFGADYHPDMIASVATVSAPFRGTQVVYDLGESMIAAPAVRKWSLGAFLTNLVHLISYISPLIPTLVRPDFHIEARGLTYRDQSFSHLLQQLHRSDWAESRDCAPFDVTFEAGEERDAEFWSLSPERSSTWYRSYYAKMTKCTSSEGSYHTPNLSSLAYSGPLYLSARSMGSFDYASLRPVPSFLSVSSPPKNNLSFVLGEEYFANDGVVPLFSQWHPGSCHPTRCVHNALPSQLEPGKWYVSEVPGGQAHHVSIIPIWYGTERQKTFWDELGVWLENVDNARANLGFPDVYT